MQTFRLFRLRFRRAYDSTSHSDFLFSQGHKRSYDSDSDSVASEKCFHKKPSPRCILFRVGVAILDPFLESPDNFSGPKSSFMIVVFMHSRLVILKTIQWKYQLTIIKINRYVSYELRYSTGFEFKICLRTQKISGTFEKQVPVNGPD